MKSIEFEEDPRSAEDEVKETDYKTEDIEMEENINQTVKLQSEEDVKQLARHNKNILCDNEKNDTNYLDICRNKRKNNEDNNNNNNNTKHIVICESKEKHRLTFGIDSILKEDVKSSNNDDSQNKYTHTNLAKANQSDKTSKTDYTRELNGACNTSDEEEIEADDFRLNAASFEAESTRARLALLRYSTSIPAYGDFNGGNCLRPGAAQHTGFQHSFSLTNTGSGFVWPSPSATSLDGRKDRFGFVRRVGHPYQNRTPPKRKKPRTSFTRLQILELEKRFERQKYLASTERSALAKSLKMTDAQVKTWFQNRRTKWRRQTAEEREIERQAANRLLLSLQPESVHRKSVVMSTDPVCLSHFQRWQDQRSADV